MSKAWKPPSSRPILIYFEFRSKPSLVTVISMDPRPTNYLRQNIVFSYPEMIRLSFSFFLSLFVFCYFTLFLIFIKFFFIIIILLIYFRENYFYFFMFRDVPECFVFLVLSTPELTSKERLIIWNLNLRSTGGVCCGGFLFLTEQMLSLPIERSWGRCVSCAFQQIDYLQVCLWQNSLTSFEA